MNDSKEDFRKIQQEIIGFILKNFISNYDKDSLPLDQSLLDLGILDSFGVVELVSFLEEHWSIAIPDSDLTREKMGSINRVTNLVLGHVEVAALPHLPSDKKATEEQHRVRRVDADDIELLFEEFRTRYRHNPRIVERDYFDWQFFDENAGRYNAFAAWEHGRPMGFIGFQPFTIIFNDRELPGAYPMQWFAERRDGTGMDLYRAMMSESSVQINVLSALESQPIFQKMGMTIISQLPRWIGFLAPAKAISRLNIDGSEILMKAMSSHERLMSLTSDGSVAQVSSFSAEKEYLSADSDVAVFVRRRGSDLNRRYVSIPRHDYRLIEGGSGFSVWRIEKILGTEEAVGRILEWTFPAHSAEAESAMAAIVAEAISENAILLDFHCSAIGVGNRLLSLGFCLADSLKPAFIPWLFRPLCNDPSTLIVNAAICLPKDATLNANTFYLTRGDSDADRIKL